MFTTPATITAVDNRTADIRVLRLMPQAPFAFDAGQYVEVGATGFEARPLSMASAPNREGSLALHVRNMGSGLSQFLYTQARPGDVIQISGPLGQMHASHARGRPVLMIGGGTGVVPLLSIAEDIVRKGTSEDGMTLIYGVRMESDIHCRQELDILAASGELTVHEAIGANTPDIVLGNLAPKLADHAVYISGPDPMLFNILPILKKLGLQDHLLHTDADRDVLMGIAR